MGAGDRGERDPPFPSATGAMDYSAFSPSSARLRQISANLRSAEQFRRRSSAGAWAAPWPKEFLQRCLRPVLLSPAASAAVAGVGGSGSLRVSLGFGGRSFLSGSFGWQAFLRRLQLLRRLPRHRLRPALRRRPGPPRRRFPRPRYRLLDRLPALLASSARRPWRRWLRRAPWPFRPARPSSGCCARTLLDSGGIEESKHAVRRLGADRQPMRNAIGVELHPLGRILGQQRIVGADLLDEAAVARIAAVGDHDAVIRTLFAPPRARRIATAILYSFQCVLLFL